MVYSADGQRVIFSGKVHVTRPDFELWAEEIEVYLDNTAKPNTKNTGDELGSLQGSTINRIVAKKNVIIKSGEKEGTSQKATFFVKEDKLVMEGSPKLKDKENTIQGDIITHNLRQNRSEVKGGVEANFLAPDSTGTQNIIPGNK